MDMQNFTAQRLVATVHTAIFNPVPPEKIPKAICKTRCLTHIISFFHGNTFPTLPPPPHAKKKQKEKTPTRMYKNRQNSQTHTLRHSGTEPAPCNAVYELFGAEVLQKLHILSTLCFYVSHMIPITININYFPTQH